jgi:hypothetical protein
MKVSLTYKVDAGRIQRQLMLIAAFKTLAVNRNQLAIALVQSTLSALLLTRGLQSGSMPVVQQEAAAHHVTMLK